MRNGARISNDKCSFVSLFRNTLFVNTEAFCNSSVARFRCAGFVLGFLAYRLIPIVGHGPFLRVFFVNTRSLYRIIMVVSNEERKCGGCGLFGVVSCSFCQSSDLCFNL